MLAIVSNTRAFTTGTRDEPMMHDRYSLIVQLYWSSGVGGA